MGKTKRAVSVRRRVVCTKEQPVVYPALTLKRYLLGHNGPQEQARGYPTCVYQLIERNSVRTHPLLTAFPDRQRALTSLPVPAPLPRAHQGPRL